MGFCPKLLRRLIDYMAILRFVFICLEVLALFNVLIFVHELGHFWAARWRGLKAERFAIWFGKPIWSRTIGGVEYALGWIPFGGYVSLPQMAPMDMIEGRPDGTPSEPLPQVGALDKIIVAFAGPLFSFLLAIVFAVGVWIIGRPVSESETTTTIGYVKKEGPADKAGLRPGDRIIEIDNKPVTKFSGMGKSITWRVVRSTGEQIPVTFERQGKIQTVLVSPVRAETKTLERRALRQIRVGPAFTSIVGGTVTNSPAFAAGLKAGDEILEFNGAKLYSFGQLEDLADQGGQQAIDLKVRRAGKDFNVSIVPEKPLSPPGTNFFLGISWMGGGHMDVAHPHPVEQVSASVGTMVDTVGAVLSKSDIGVQHLSGAVKILNIYYLLFESDQGWRLALWFSVVMNVNLALLNLLPLPILDGGHIALALIEAVRRRPISAQVLQYLQTGCFALLLMFMLFVTFFDSLELFHGRGEKPPVLQFAPKPALTSTPPR
jgi:regulator of sigma E protease